MLNSCGTNGIVYVYIASNLYTVCQQKVRKVLYHPVVRPNLFHKEQFDTTGHLLLTKDNLSQVVKSHTSDFPCFVDGNFSG